MIHGLKDGEVKIKYYTASGRAAIKTVDAETLSDVHENPIVQHAGRV